MRLLTIQYLTITFNVEMMKFIFACLFYFYCVCGNDECTINVQKSDNPPIVYYENYSLFPYVKKGGNVTFNVGEQLILYCPSTTHILKRPNFLLASGSDITNIICLKRNYIVYPYGLQKLTLNSKLIKCDHAFVGRLKTLNEGRCTRGADRNISELYAVRFFIEPTCFIDFFYVCFVEKTNTVIYAVHLLHGGEGTPSSREKTCVCHEKNLYFFNEEKIQNIYSLQTQLKLYPGAITKDSYYTQAYLVPFLDIPYPGLHCTIDCRKIVTPMLNHVVDGNWKEMEEMIRQHAYKTRETFRIYTGTTSGSFVSYGSYDVIYLLRKGSAPVCAFVWKIVHSLERNAAIVFLVANTVTKERSNYRSVCDENGWGSSSWNIKERGYLYCFSYEDFPFIEEPPELPKVGLLQGPN